MEISVRKLMLETEITEWLLSLIDKYQLNKYDFIYFRCFTFNISNEVSIGEFLEIDRNHGINFMLELFYNFKGNLRFQLRSNVEEYSEKKELNIAKYLLPGYVDRLVLHIIDTIYNVIEEKCTISRSHEKED